MVGGGRQRSASAFTEDNAALAFGVCPRWAAHRRADRLFNLQPSWRERQSCMSMEAEFALFLIAACAHSVWAAGRFHIEFVFSFPVYLLPAFGAEARGSKAACAALDGPKSRLPLAPTPRLGWGLSQRSCRPIAQPLFAGPAMNRPVFDSQRPPAPIPAPAGEGAMRIRVP